MNPGAIDSLSEFTGTYTATFKDAGGQAPRPVELGIAASKSGEQGGFPTAQQAPWMCPAAQGLADASGKPQGSPQAEKSCLPVMQRDPPESG